MRAVRWYGKKDVRVENVPDPKIINPRDVIVEVTSTAICGSDLHFYHGYVMGMKKAISSDTSSLVMSSRSAKA